MPVCVPTNNQNNTDGDIQVNQHPDIFNDGPIVVPPESNGSTSNEDPDNLEPFFAKISRIKETSPKSITSDPTPDHAHLPQSQTTSTPTPPSNCVSVIRSNTQAQPGKIQHASVIPRETPYTVPPKVQCDQCDFSSRSQHGLKIHTGIAHKLHTVSLPCTTSAVYYNLIPVNASNNGVINYVLQPQPSSTLLSQNAPAFSAPATSIIPNSTAIPTPDTTPDPEPEKTENAVQKCRRIKKEKKDEDLLMTEFLIDDNTRLKATIAILEQQLGLPQSQTSSMPPTRCVTVSESNTHAHPGKIQRGSVIHRETPYTVPPKFQCDQCDFSSPSQHGLKIHTGKAHKLHTVDLSSTARDPADAKRSREYRLREKIKEDNAVEKLKSLKEQNKNLKDQEAQLRTRVEQSLFK